MNTNLDLLGIIISIVLPAFSGIYFFVTKRSEFLKASRNLSTDVTGDWFSAESDFKHGRLDNALTKIRISRKYFGNRIFIKVVEQLDKDKIIYETSWRVIGKIYPDATVLGDFVGENNHSLGHGVVFLKFIGKGRAIGYWVGYSGWIAGQPMYGYWILSRDEKDLRNIAGLALSKFQYMNIKYLIENSDKKILEKDFILKLKD